tara:strand:- start:3500 stop:4627 length:1128 start_codon:yes stop_codon:yes gene_type:complete
MGRKKTKTKSGLPPRVYAHTTSYYYRPVSHKDKLKPVKLCRLDAPLSEVYDAYYKKVVQAQKKNETFWDLTQLWLINETTTNKRLGKQLAKGTLDFYRRRFKTKTSPVMREFGDLFPADITTKQLQMYSLTRWQIDSNTRKVKLNDDGEKILAAGQANKEIGVISQIFAFGCRMGFCETNPALNVKKHEMRDRDRYITDKEFIALHDGAPRYLQIMMELSYYCALRKSDTLALRREHVLDDGLLCQDAKASASKKKTVTSLRAWTDGLRETIRKATSVISHRGYIVHKNGRQPSRTTINRDWAKAKKAAGLDYPQGHELHLTFHDIKAKSISDFDGNDQEKTTFSGHSSIKMMRVYSRKNEPTRRATLTPKLTLR